MEKGNIKAAMFNNVDQWKQSGLAQNNFCEQCQIRYHIFHYWYKQYKKKNGTNINGVSAFVPLNINPSSITDPFAEIIFADGKRLL